MREEQLDLNDPELIDKLQKMPKSMILEYMVRGALASGRGISDIFSTRSQVPDLICLVDPKKTEGESTMSKPYTEQQRINDLERIRTPRNGHIIDETIRNGQTASHAAMETIKGGYLLTEEEAVQAHADAILAEVSSIMAETNVKKLAGKMQKAMTENERIDAVAAIDWDNL